MHATEIVPAHIESNSMFQVLQFPAVGVGQASKAPERHSQGQVDALDMRSRNVTRVRSAILDAWDSSRNPARGTVPLGASDVVARIQLDEANQSTFKKKMGA
jgi:hypothetical protein